MSFSLIGGNKCPGSLVFTSKGNRISQIIIWSSTAQKISEQSAYPLLSVRKIVRCCVKFSKKSIDKFLKIRYNISVIMRVNIYANGL